MAFISILITGGILLIIWLCFAAFLGFIGLLFFLWGLVPYHRIPAGRSKTAQYIKMAIGFILMAAALFGLCAIFPLRIFAACLMALTGAVVLCFAVPKRMMLPSDVNHSTSTAAIVIGIILIAASVLYMTFSGVALVISIIKAIRSS